MLVVRFELARVRIEDCQVRERDEEIDLQQYATIQRPEWVSEAMFPFRGNYFTTPSGHRMHYVDEGDGEPIVFCTATRRGRSSFGI